MQRDLAPGKSQATKIMRPHVDRHFTVGRFVFVLCVLIFAEYPDIVLGSHAFSYRDAGLFGYPLAYYFRHCFWHGELPLWNPYSDCGIPFLAQWNTIVLYPFSIFYLLVPLPWSMNFFILGHVLLAGIGMYFLAHRWFENRFAASVAGLAFAWNGLSLHFLMWPGNIATLAWMPWIVLLVERAASRGRRWIIWASFAGAMQMMTGSPEIISFTWLLALAFVALEIFEKKISFKPAVVRSITIVVLVAGLSAAQLLPFFDLLRHGNRDSSFGNDAWSLPAWGFANFLVPLFRCTPSVIGVFSQDEQQWTSSYYAGIAILGLALIALFKIRKSRTALLSVAAIAGIFFALGSAGFIFPALKHIFPALGFVRFPIKFIVVTIFCFPLLASAGIVWLKNQNSDSTRRTLIGIALLICAAVFVILILARYFPFPDDSWKVTAQNGLVRISFLIAIFLGIYFQQRITQTSWKILVSFGILFLFGLDVSTHTPRQVPTVITRAYEPYQLQMSQTPRLGNSRAMITPEVQNRMDRSAHPYPLNLYLGQRAVLLANCNLLERIPKVNGFFTLHLREEYSVESLLYEEPDRRFPAMENFLGVSQTTSSTQLFKWNERTNFLPMATIGQKPVFADDATILSAIASPQFDSRKTVYLPRDAEEFVSVTNSSEAKILSSDFAAQKISINADAKSAAILVLAQSYYHVWKPRVDGKPVKLLRANYGFQAVEIPAGKHHIEFTYEDWNFRIGAAISLGVLAGCIGFLFLPSRR